MHTRCCLSTYNLQANSPLFFFETGENRFQEGPIPHFLLFGLFGRGAQLVEFETGEYHSAIVRDPEEAQKLVEAGFDYVCSHNETMLFRKRK
jgi:hypothetical protein